MLNLVLRLVTAKLWKVNIARHICISVLQTAVFSQLSPLQFCKNTLHLHIDSLLFPHGKRKLIRFIPCIKFPTPHLAHVDSIIFHAENYSFQVIPKKGYFHLLELSWAWGKQAPPKRRKLITNQHAVILQKTVIFIQQQWANLKPTILNVKWYKHQLYATITVY